MLRNTAEPLSALQSTGPGQSDHRSSSNASDSVVFCERKERLFSLPFFFFAYLI